MDIKIQNKFKTPEYPKIEFNESFSFKTNNRKYERAKSSDKRANKDRVIDIENNNIKKSQLSN